MPADNRAARLLAALLRRTLDTLEKSRTVLVVRLRVRGGRVVVSHQVITEPKSSAPDPSVADR